MLHPEFAKSPEHYVRAFLLLLKDLKNLFDYVEPAEKNLGCYSYRIHALLLRACVEVEANCRAILQENGYRKRENRDMNMDDYKKLDTTHRLSFYQVKIPFWSGKGYLRSPFSCWSKNEGLPWYQAYNAIKHDRHDSFESATFEHLLDAICGLLVVLSSQFETNDFSPSNGYLMLEGSDDGMKSGIGGFFRVQFPDWPKEMRYDFDWQELENEEDPFQTFNYCE